MALPPFTEFQAELAATARDTEALLDTLLGEKGAAAGRLIAAMRYTALGAGKRLRPYFVVASGRLFGVPPESALRAGAALECVHCYSLVHDDLPAMDDDDLRRGKPTVHRAFDEATAILAGDSLLTLAFEILADPATHAHGEVRSLLVGELAKASGKDGMAGGQMLDLDAEKAPTPSLDETIKLQRLKTGALFRFACEAGAIMGHGQRAPLRHYAECVGLAFQITDDILDVQSTPGALGKATQKDGKRGKATFVELMGLEKAKREADRQADEAIAALAPFGGEAESLRQAARFIVSREK